MKENKFKIGTQVSFDFAGQKLKGKIKEIMVDNSYSIQTTWYKIEHTNGTIYPIRTDSKSIKKI